MVKSENKEPQIKISKRLQNIFSVVFVMVMFVSVALVNELSSLGSFAQRIVASWTPSENIGKLKYVSTDESEYSEVVSLFNIDYSLPFANGVCQQGNSEGEIIVEGNGDEVVLAPYKSKVESVAVDGAKKVVTFDCGFSIKIVYHNVDVVGVKEGERVTKGQIIGTSKDSKIIVNAFFRGNPYTKFKVIDGKVSL